MNFSWYNNVTLTKDNTGEHNAKKGKNETPFKDGDPKKTIPYRTAHTYLAPIWKNPPRVVTLLSKQMVKSIDMV